MKINIFTKFCKLVEQSVLLFNPIDSPLTITPRLGSDTGTYSGAVVFINGQNPAKSVHLLLLDNITFNPLLCSENQHSPVYPEHSQLHSPLLLDHTNKHTHTERATLIL